MSHSPTLARLETDLRMAGHAKGTIQQHVASNPRDVAKFLMPSAFKRHISASPLR